MHTTTKIAGSDFRYLQLDPGAAREIDFHTFCPDYHPQDRIAVVCDRVDEGMLHTAYALLACTTAFYDTFRARRDDFFIYPQHFCIMVEGEDQMVASVGNARVPAAAAGNAWGNLDVWPACMWKTAPASTSCLIQTIFDLQINRVFWPAASALRTSPPHETGPSLPAYVRRILATSLKQVCYYRSDEPSVELQVRRHVEDLVAYSIDRLPGASLEELAQIKRARQPDPHDRTSPWTERHQAVPPEEFLQHIAHVFS